MSIDVNIENARRLFHAWGQASDDVVDKLVTPDFTVYYPLLQQPLHGPEAFKALLRAIHAGAPDIDVVIEEIKAIDDIVLLRWSEHGTHLGELLGIPATGKRFNLTGLTLYRFRDGKVYEERGEEDALGLLQQLGVVPSLDEIARSSSQQ